LAASAMDCALTPGRIAAMAACWASMAACCTCAVSSEISLM
jgi:hypothetical protein